MGVGTIARRYAGALADVVVSSGSSEEVTAELNSWNELIKSNQDLRSAFSNPSIAHLSKEKVLESLIGKTGPSQTTANFLRVLLRNSRLTELDSITTKFVNVLEERSGKISGTVISARELTGEEKESFKNSLLEKTGKEVKLEFGVDPELIGGAVTRVGSTIFDGSVRTQLDSLREQMIKS
ncbi:MAG: ATP synthase F1 subunit delta [Pyrinomonadaceae bacterium]|nr:ATP synthase F1 subunit delta [Pyrinomonadaceae bacterium]